MCACVCVCVSVCIYIHMHIHTYMGKYMQDILYKCKHIYIDIHCRHKKL